MRSISTKDMHLIRIQLVYELNLGQGGQQSRLNTVKIKQTLGFRFI